MSTKLKLLINATFALTAIAAVASPFEVPPGGLQLVEGEIDAVSRAAYEARQQSIFEAAKGEDGLKLRNLDDRLTVLDGQSTYGGAQDTEQAIVQSVQQITATLADYLAKIEAAQSAASTAQNTANGAQGTASSAHSLASAANSTANSAVNSINNLGNAYASKSDVQAAQNKADQAYTEALNKGTIKEHSSRSGTGYGWETASGLMIVR